MDSEVEDLNFRAKFLADRFEKEGGINYIDEAIGLDHAALELCPRGHPKLPVSLNLLAVHLWHRYKQLGEMMNLEEAIAINREVLALRPPGHPDRSASLSNLAGCLSTLYEKLGVMKDLDEAIMLARSALALRPQGHRERPISLNNLAVHLTTRYFQLGAMKDLDEAIDLERDVLVLCPQDHSDRILPLHNLAVHLSTRYKQLGSMNDLDEAIILDRDVLALYTSGSPARLISLTNLATHLCYRYNNLGKIEDLNEAVILNRDILVHRPPGHPDRAFSLKNLAVVLSTRYEHLGAMEDLNEAIILGREVLVLHPHGHPNRSSSLSNLAVYLFSRYEVLRDVEDLTEAIVLDRDALAIRPLGHPERPFSLINLAAHLSSHYDQFGTKEDLDEAISLSRDALSLCPPGHPERFSSLSNLAFCLSTRYEQLDKIDDLDEAIDLERDALALRLPGHPGWSKSLKNLAAHFSVRYSQLEEVEDYEELFTLYAQLAHIKQTVSSTDLFAAKSWVGSAEQHHHPTILLAYETSLRLLVQHLATLPTLPQHLSILKNLASSLGVDAFSACLRNHSVTSAVEFLEQGRGLFWNQLARLRSPLDDVIASGPAGTTLAGEFTRLTSLIRSVFDLPGADQHDRVYSLNVELQRVVTDIRELPGLSRFLLPSLFSELQQAACEGPVIIVNESKYSCDALVVLIDRDPVHIPLSITKTDVEELASKLRMLTVRAKSMSIMKDLGRILRTLWDDVVSHIVEFLLTIHPPQSRIWWCPTAEFSLLPMHAAGTYRRGQQNLPDIYISSYTPTLMALIRARRHGPLNSATNKKRFIAIGQANADGEAELFSVSTELANIAQRVDRLATFTRIEGSESCIARVSEELGKSNWVHFACHGLPNPNQPFESAFALRDGHFTIRHIIQCQLENPQFAYLSACHTTVGDEESPDEVIHLASAMQFAGFRSVIGTMWAVDDDETNKITSTFYDNMKNECGQLDHTRAAFALNKTMGTVDIPFDQRVLYIHLGA